MPKLLGRIVCWWRGHHTIPYADMYDDTHLMAYSCKVCGTWVRVIGMPGGRWWE